MARKRGGLAGIWDRNKKIIKPIASGLAGLFLTPAAGAAVGAAMEGLDRPGKSGIGFDVGKGAMGAIQGYAAGSAGAGVGKLFSPGAIPGVAGAMPKAAITPGGVPGMTKIATTSPNLFAQGSARQALSGATGALRGAAPQISRTVASAAPEVAGGVTNAATTGGAVASKSLLGDLFTAEGLGGVTKGALTGYQGYQTNATERARLAQNERQFGRTAALAEQRFAEEQRSAGVTERMAAEKFAEEQRLNKLDEERRRRVASLMALFAPRVLGSLGQAQGGAQGGAMG